MAKATGTMDILQTLWLLVVTLATLVTELLLLGLNYFFILLALAWCVWGINWRKAWPALARGAWAPVVLALLMAALVWSRVAPGDCTCLQIVAVPNFWWQLGYVSMLAASVLFCGWLQGFFGWQVPEVQLEPPSPERESHDVVVDQPHHHHGH